MCNPKSVGEQRSIALFPLGRIVATPGALEALDRYAINAMDLIKRHQSGDWGNVPPGDAEENLRSIENGWRILSSYALSENQNLWIITEADRSVTTLLLPEEY
ncbi:type I restriction endonuclease subunit M [Nitrosomonas sp. Is35]|uniref:type I restriction endonuclease subunit M n=1 Tax=Nitrosomonas sp. Is35 TaxID=3080534 RepID=UPI00294B459B|nr:type I restriction endonuclease subunit M [Nitrosomonas sp. Is35]MDV6347652.1 type I restriction endonuclease subunit M [Nitrosomonas sp. Is35]